MLSRTANALRLTIASGAAVLGVVIGPQHVALAQDARTCVIAAGADTGAVEGMGPLAGGTLIGAAKGLFLARDVGGRIAISALSSDADTGRIFALQDLPGAGLLVGTENGLF